MAVLGTDPVIFSISWQINLIYQFWIHTRYIKTLGPLEWIMNSPSHHRVHHGKNPQYIDKNYAGVFIIWDRLFGTFTPETVEPVYGVVKPLNSWNPVWANLEVWVGAARLLKTFPRWQDRLKIWWKGPGWTPAQPHPTIPEVSVGSYQKFDTALSSSTKWYVLFQFVLVMVFTLMLSGQMLTWSFAQKAVGSVWILFSLASLGWVMENRGKLCWFSEGLRMGAAVVVAGVIYLL